MFSQSMLDAKWIILFHLGSEVGRKPEDCELDSRENEILFFLLIVVMIRSRKTGASNSMTSYFASGFVYAKVANLILFFRTDPR